MTTGECKTTPFITVSGTPGTEEDSVYSITGNVRISGWIKQSKGKKIKEDRQDV